MGWKICVLAAVVGIAAGVGSALLATQGGMDGGIRAGAWSTNVTVGAASADPWTRATVARAGLLALSADQAVYFNRSADSEGRPLDARCTYRLSGGPQPAAWWSVTLYAEDQYLARNTDSASSIDATLAGNGAWTALVGPDRPPSGMWISTRASKRPVLMLRLYSPRSIAADVLAKIKGPDVVRFSCPGEEA
ncbi:DUF1214 domain-containing protein [Sphingomonas sp. 28-62-11]|uniref:DUF1214 domain-containing protein n=1 Tax=Sphingomonas sp. 28-62-11 TaxID=1970432 RepID=UPI000BD8658C|nr:MAG: hypothetical protein B7Y49_12045 [Sphingomonas sp. 28-62-11]